MATGRVPTTANSPLTTKGDLFGYSTAPARLAVGNDGETIVADSSTATGLRYQANFAAGKNKIINGDFFINQRNFSSSTGVFDYIFDRFPYYYVSGTTTASVQTFTPGAAPVAGYEARNFARLAVTGQTGGTAQCVLYQNIEDVRNFAGQTITVSFWAKAGSGTPKIGVAAIQSFGSGGSPSAQVITGGGSATISTSWARYSVNVTVPSISGKTIGTTANTSFIQITLVMSDAANSYGTSVGTQNATFDVWGVQAEANATATAFQTATGTIQGELAACQRYYNRFTAPEAYSHFAQGWAISTDNMTAWFYLPVEMRVVPTTIDYASVNMGDGVNAQVTPSTITFTSANNNTKTIACTGTKSAGGMTQYRGYQFLAAGTTAAYIGFSAEL